MRAWLTASATELARDIREKRATSREIVDAHIAHIESVNPSLNAIVAERFKEARQEADAADQKVASSSPEELPLFHGVPCTIKECFQLEGMPQTAGLVARRGTISKHDGVTVQRYRSAGAIPLGVTNVSELCMWLETNNQVYGRSRNPYDPGRIVGGSSGGEGSIIGAGGSPFGLGSDLGGSIRMPAFFNGVFGHKPTGGLIPVTGQYPCPSDGDAMRYVTSGPLCRKAEDLWPLLEILAGPDPSDPECTAWELGHPSQVDLSQLRILNIPTNGRFAVHRDLQESQTKVANYLKSLGAQVEDCQVHDLKYSLQIWASMLGSSQTPNTFRNMMGYESPWPLWWEMAKWCAGMSKHTVPAILLAIFDNIGSWFPKHTEHMVRLGIELRESLTALLGDNGVILYPPYVRPAPLHNQPLLTPYEWAYTAIFNVMEFPATQIPTGLNRQGLPLGVQAVAAPGNDHLTVAVAQALEAGLGGWTPPWNL